MPHDGNYGPSSTDPKGIFRRTCPCGKAFRTNHPFQRYHTPACKRQAQNRRHYQRHGARTRAAMRQADDLTDGGQNDPTQ